jgi:hypothetical protein
MVPEFSRFVDEAASISTSGRWAAINEKIESLSASPGASNEWWVEFLGKLCFKVFSEYLLLKRAYEENDKETPLLAWRARNLLELSIWCVYCTKSRENARRFYEDAGRDLLGIHDAFTRWGTATGQGSEWLGNIAEGKKDISRQAVADGIPSLDGSFKDVREAADEVGLGDHFKLSYRMLSKVAHPTALQILGNRNSAQVESQNDMFFSQGCLLFAGAFEALEKRLLEAATQEASSGDPSVQR